MASEGAQNRRFSASVSNTIDGLSKPNTAGNRTQPDITERRQPSSSHIDAIPDAPIADSSVPEQPYAPDFERELVAALRLDIDPHAQQLDKPDAVPCNEDTSVSSRTQSLAIGPGTVSDSGISATRPTLEDVEIPGPQLDEGTTENGQGQVNDERHVNDPESQRLRDRPYEPPRITFSASDDDSHQHEQAQVGNEDSGVPSRSLSHASNVTASESLSQESNVTLVLASKAVRAGQIHLVINGVPQAIPAGEKYPGLNFDEWRSSHEEQAGDGSLDSTEAQPAFSTGEPKTLKLTHTDDGSPPVGSKAQGHPSSPQGQHVRQTPSFSSLGASEAGLSAQQPQLGCGLGKCQLRCLSTYLIIISTTKPFGSLALI